MKYRKGMRVNIAGLAVVMFMAAATLVSVGILNNRVNVVSKAASEPIKVLNPIVAFYQDNVITSSLSASPSKVFRVTGSGWGRNSCLLIYISTSPVSGGQQWQADANGNFTIDNWPTWMLNTSGQPGGTPAKSATFTFKVQTQGGKCVVKVEGAGTVTNYTTVKTVTIPVIP